MQKTGILLICLLLVGTIVKAQTPTAIVTADSLSASFPKLKETDPSVNIMDSMLQALYSSNPAWKFIESDYISNGYAVQDTPVFTSAVYRERIESISSTIPYIYNDQVRAYIDLYTMRRRTQMQNMLGLSQVYFPLFEEVLDKNGMPEELKYLSIIESALNTNAVSKAGATGLWQLMYGTGKLLGVKIDTYVDERRDPYVATHAAVTYLKQMHGIYHDWLLAIAAYNCGPGNVNKALRKAGGSNKTFWDIMAYLPKETRGYVPAFIGATYAFKYHKEHNIRPLVYGYTYTMLDTVMINRKVTLNQLAPFTGISSEEIALYNPSLKLKTIPGSPTSFPLRLPVKCIAMYYANEDSLFNSLTNPDINIASNTVASKTSDKSTTTAAGAVDAIATNYTDPVKVNYTVKKGDNLGYISDWFDCSIPDIKKWNALKTTKLSIGQKLKMYVPASKSDVYAQINSMSMAQKQNLTSIQIVGVSKTDDQQKADEIIYYTVRPGDTLWSISKKYPENSIQELRDLNNLAQNSTLKSGDKIKVVK